MRNTFLLIAIFFGFGCADSSLQIPEIDQDFPAVTTEFGDELSLENPFNYANQSIPSYIDEDNARNDRISDRAATLGRVLFYDKTLSVDGTVACASCHLQEFAFGDTDVQSQGVDGLTGRHSMRLVNNRYSEEERYFWDERATSLEDQVLQPIQDHVEMGFSGENGDPDLADLINRMGGVNYYPELFQYAFDSPNITEAGMRDALAQFVRSIQSFDSKYDEGRSQVNDDMQAFSNFTTQENNGKALFGRPANFNNMGQRTGGGLGCQACHGAPEFGINDNSGNNGVIGSAGNLNAIDDDVTKAPSLRDLVNPSGQTNGGMMHTGSFNTIRQVLEHYNDIPNAANGLDRRLRPNGNAQELNMSEQEFGEIVAFLRTLTGSDVYVNQKWSDPFGD